MDRPEKFILIGREVVPENDLMKWAKAFESSNRQIAKSVVMEPVTVSTIFLGSDHSHGAGGPKLFETMIFGGTHDQFQDRCGTYEEAEAMHQRAIDMIKGGA